MRLTGQHFELLPHEGRVRGVGGNVQVVGLRRIPVLFALKNGDIASGTITSTELSGSEAPLLLSTRAQKALGLVIDTEEHTVYSKRMNQYLELVDRDGLPAIRLIPSTEDETDIALQAEISSAQEEDSVDMSSNATDATSPSSTSSLSSPMTSNCTSSQKSTSMDTSSQESRLDKSAIEEEDTLSYVNLAESPRKVMTRGQRKMMTESTEAVHKEDLALWGTLRHHQGLRRPGRLLPSGCRCFLMELFAGAAILTTMAAAWGLPVGRPIDVCYDPGHDLLKPSNRQVIGDYIGHMDPFILIAGPGARELCDGGATEMVSSVQVAHRHLQVSLEKRAARDDGTSLDQCGLGHQMSRRLSGFEPFP